MERAQFALRLQREDAEEDGERDGRITRKYKDR